MIILFKNVNSTEHKTLITLFFRFCSEFFRIKFVNCDDILKIIKYNFNDEVEKIETSKNVP